MHQLHNNNNKLIFTKILCASFIQRSKMIKQNCIINCTFSSSHSFHALYSIFVCFITSIHLKRCNTQNVIKSSQNLNKIATTSVSPHYALILSFVGEQKVLLWLLHDLWIIYEVNKLFFWSLYLSCIPLFLFAIFFNFLFLSLNAFFKIQQNAIFQLHSVRKINISEQNLK